VRPSQHACRNLRRERESAPAPQSPESALRPGRAGRELERVPSTRTIERRTGRVARRGRPRFRSQQPGRQRPPLLLRRRLPRDRRIHRPRRGTRDDRPDPAVGSVPGPWDHRRGRRNAVPVCGARRSDSPGTGRVDARGSIGSNFPISAGPSGRPLAVDGAFPPRGASARPLGGPVPPPISGGGVAPSHPSRSGPRDSPGSRDALRALAPSAIGRGRLGGVLRPRRAGLDRLGPACLPTSGPPTPLRVPDPIPTSFADRPRRVDAPWSRSDPDRAVAGQSGGREAPRILRPDPHRALRRVQLGDSPVRGAHPVPGLSRPSVLGVPRLVGSGRNARLVPLLLPPRPDRLEGPLGLSFFVRTQLSLPKATPVHPREREPAVAPSWPGRRRSDPRAARASGDLENWRAARMPSGAGKRLGLARATI